MPELPDANAQMQTMMRAAMPRLYANGFGLAQSASDISVVVLHNNVPTGMISMSYISAKSLLEDLGTALQGIEEALGQSIPTIGEVGEKLQKTQGKPNV